MLNSTKAVHCVHRVHCVHGVHTDPTCGNDEGLLEPVNVGRGHRPHLAPGNVKGETYISMSVFSTPPLC
jgi:hypothetical protein